MTAEISGDNTIDATVTFTTAGWDEEEAWHPCLASHTSSKLEWKESAVSIRNVSGVEHGSLRRQDSEEGINRRPGSIGRAETLRRLLAGQERRPGVSGMYGRGRFNLLE